MERLGKYKVEVLKRKTEKGGRVESENFLWF